MQPELTFYCLWGHRVSVCLCAVGCACQHLGTCGAEECRCDAMTTESQSEGGMVIDRTKLPIGGFRINDAGVGHGSVNIGELDCASEPVCKLNKR